jgi:hypothetical protein
MILSGASRISLEGSGADLDVNASGASVVELGNFLCNDADIDLSGASRATVNASDTLSVTLSGASTLYYYGTPTLGSLTVSGGSTIHKVD